MPEVPYSGLLASERFGVLDVAKNGNVCPSGAGSGDSGRPPVVKAGAPATGVELKAGVAVKTRTSWLSQNTLPCPGSVLVKYGSAPPTSSNSVTAVAPGSGAAPTRACALSTSWMGAEPGAGKA